MYARTVDGQDLNFAVSGKLWNRSLVMRDQETETFWSHLLGEAMEGALKGHKLELLASQMTDWKQWSAQHPETTVVKLSRTSQEYRREFYEDPSLFVLGVSVGGVSKAWGFDRLKAERVINDQVGSLPLAIFFDVESMTALAFERRLDGEEVRFRAVDDRIVDLSVGSIWNGTTGKSVNGEAIGRFLTPVPAKVSGLIPWVTFHPETEGLSETAIEHARENSFLRRRGRQGKRRQ